MTNQKQPELKGEKYARLKRNLIGALAGAAFTAGIIGATAFYETNQAQQRVKTNHYQRLEAITSPKNDAETNQIPPYTSEELAFFSGYGLTPTNGVFTEAQLKTLDYLLSNKANRLSNPDLFPTNSRGLESKVETETPVSVPAPAQVPKPEVKTNYPVKNKDNYSHPITQNFVDEIIYAESQGKSKATSPKGARGLMQVMPKTWAEQTKKIYGKSLPFSYAYNPEINKKVGTNYLIELHESLSNELPIYETLTLPEQQKKIAAAYNGGPNRLIKNAGKIEKMPRETRKYVAKIHGRLYASR